MTSLLPGLSATPVALTVEMPLDEVLKGSPPPAPLTPEQAEELLACLTQDLARILEQPLEGFGAVMPGGLYDITEILRPGLPMVETLFELYRGGLRQGGFVPQLMAIGGHDGGFPVEAIAPRRRPGSGPLLILPLVFIGEREKLEQLQTRMETLLLEKGQASRGTETCIRRHFGLMPENLAYATFNDLCALLKIQLGHAGMESLWELLECALYRPQEGKRVELPTGNVFRLNGSVVHTPFLTFDAWAARHGGADIDSYLEWVKQQRVMEAGLRAHGLQVIHLGPEAPADGHCSGHWQRTAAAHALNGPLLSEPEPPAGVLEGASFVLLTEQGTPELGPVAYTVLVQAADGQLLYLGNQYPLEPGQIAAIRRHWTEAAAAHGVELHLARPNRLMVSADGRQLVPALEF